MVYEDALDSFLTSLLSKAILKHKEMPTRRRAEGLHRALLSRPLALSPSSSDAPRRPARFPSTTSTCCFQTC